MVEDSENSYAHIYWVHHDDDDDDDDARRKVWFKCLSCKQHLTKLGGSTGRELQMTA